MRQTVETVCVAMNTEEIKCLKNLMKNWKCNKSSAIKRAIETINFQVKEELKSKEIKDDIHRT